MKTSKGQQTLMYDYLRNQRVITPTYGEKPSRSVLSEDGEVGGHRWQDCSPEDPIWTRAPDDQQGGVKEQSGGKRSHLVSLIA